MLCLFWFATSSKSYGILFIANYLKDHTKVPLHSEAISDVRKKIVIFFDLLASTLFCF